MKTELTEEEAEKKKVELANAKLYRKAADIFFEGVSEYFKREKLPEITFEKEYLSGYFIFAYGKDSVVHFYTNVCPGWKFGIWWNLKESNDTKSTVVGFEFFAQYEETIDKFKPSRSHIAYTDQILLPKRKNEAQSMVNSYAVCESARLIAFIMNEPDLAFCRDYWGYDYNREYLTREEAKIEFEKYKADKLKRDAAIAEADKLWLDFINEKVIPAIPGAKLEDWGESWSPRYEVVAPYSKNKKLVDKPALYGFEQFEEFDFCKEYESVYEKCKELTSKYIWSKPAGPYINFKERKRKKNDD